MTVRSAVRAEGEGVRTGVDRSPINWHLPRTSHHDDLDLETMIASGAKATELPIQLRSMGRVSNAGENASEIQFGLGRSD